MNNAQGRRLKGAGIILAIVAGIAVGALLSRGNSPFQPSHSEKMAHEGTFKTGDVVWSKYDDRKIPGCKTDEDVYRYHRHGRENDVDAQTAMVFSLPNSAHSSANDGRTDEVSQRQRVCKFAGRGRLPVDKRGLAQEVMLDQAISAAALCGEQLQVQTH
jgi:hypothetical protein